MISRDYWDEYRVYDAGGVEVAAIVRDHLRETFDDFAARGRWSFCDARMGWFADGWDGVLADEFPVEISITPAQFLAAAMFELTPNMNGPEDMPPLIAALEHWRAAVDAALESTRAIAASLKPLDAP